MNELETRLIGDLAALASTVSIDEDAAWPVVLERAATDSLTPHGFSRVLHRRRRMFTLAAAAVVLAVGGAVIAVVASRGGGEPGPQISTRPPATPTSTTAPASSLGGRIAVLPSSAGQPGDRVSLAEREWATGERPERVLQRADGGAWARVDIAPSAWDLAAAKIGAGVDPLDLGGLDGMVFQEYTTWVVAWQQAADGVILRSNGLERAGVIELATELAHGREPAGWTATVDLPAWNSITSTDRFGTMSIVQSTEVRPDTDLRVLALALAVVGTTPEPVDVAGSPGWLVQRPPPIPGVDRLLLVEKDGVAVAVGRQDASDDELRELAAAAQLVDIGGPGTPAVSVAGTIAASSAQVHILERGVAGGHRYQWAAVHGSREVPETGSTVDTWCVEYSDHFYRPELQAVCAPSQGEFHGVAEIVAGTAVGVVDSDITGAWFVVDGRRVDATLSMSDDLRMIRATLPLGSRISLHLQREDGSEVPGEVRYDVTLSCMGCPAPVIAPADWIMPTLTPSGVEIPSTSPSG